MCNFHKWLRLIRRNTFFIILALEKINLLLCKLFPCSFLMQLQCCRGRLCTDENSAACGTTCARTFVFISSRPTVATVLVCCLLFFSSFCGLSRRCSRRLITWFSPVARRRGGGGLERAEDEQGGESRDAAE